MPRGLELFPKTIYCIDAIDLGISNVLFLSSENADITFTVTSSSLINLMPHWKRDVYRRDVFPAIWEKLESMINNEELISPLEVYEEIKVGQDELYDWCKNNKKMFRDIDDCQRQKFQDVEKQYDKNYWENEINKPRWADPWVIALSVCEEAIIVADEKNTRNRIPFISYKFNVKCLELLDIFKEIGMKY